ncbi:MAG TPA: alkaline phosphatase family protein, partial [Candidatus Binatus sp.]|nr:alkaline phosphatase family protein [Candidatus Binatus sp.]
MLAGKGSLGLVYTVGKNVAPESDAGVFSLLGYDPLTIHLARGVVEALGAGVNFQDGDLALRAGFATVEGDRLVDRRAGRNLSTEEARELASAINKELRLKEGIRFEFHSTVGHRAVVVFHHGNFDFSSNISNFDPAYVRKGNVSIAIPSKKNYELPMCEPLDKKPGTIKSAALINEFGYKVRDILDKHPTNTRRRREGKLAANWILMRDAGTEKPKIPSFREKWGMAAAMIADLPVELGIGKLLQMEVEQLEPGTSLEGYNTRAKLALSLVKNHDFVYVHLKGPDEPGHDGMMDLKKQRIEEIDAGFFQVLAKSKEVDDIIVCVTCDHSTPWRDKAHSDDPVPVLLVNHDSSTTKNLTHRFSEMDAKNGSLGIIQSGRMILEQLKSEI